ncbi:S-adenosylmethionine--diacylglycerol 3-amino-3-carboxypropyl transferase [Thiomicrorhabdus immobilis]|uniref:S-adenosylmethionine--diacylglycerol 3-amino-3-carboxypropyl transferase n=1 Tax=Thiomicrorhabdus immobilis TaxID=2791037 RepID=A0ABM7MAV3_9GAMM|nr:BtaA family protein [Thiomicrorhabdus immobilis]BCN92483.1 S-adenosylmethionine--diacylglycerol 3-amino-3-carboxypropyl transferase [Thiomicrorhabdus immobilis]
MNSSTTLDALTQTPKTKTLLDSAVNNTSIFSRKGFLDRLFTTWFDRLVYPQIWEDPEVDIQALQINNQSRVFTISSGGCNVLNYLTEQPELIEVVDLNEAHIALIKLKLVAIEHLPNSEAFFDFFGKANLLKNLDRYEAYIKPHLDNETLAYWESKERPWSKKRITYFTNGFYKHGLLGHFIGLIHWTGKRLGYDISKIMQARTLEEQQQGFDQHVAPIFDTKLLKFLCNRSMVMYSLGIPPAQFDEMDKQSQDSKLGMHNLLKERARQLACDFPLDENYFAWQAFNREYDIKHRKAIPRYLKKEAFAVLKSNQSKVKVSHTSMTERLKSLPDNSLNAYLFLDAQDWMDERQLTELWQEVNRTAMPNARVVFRTAGETSPLETKLADEILNQWQTNQENNQAWTKQDRSGIYGGVHLYIRKPHNQSMQHSQQTLMFGE